MELKDYLGTVASQLVNELRPILEIKAVTNNTDLLGKYTESAIRHLVKRIVHPMRVLTGAVVDHPVESPLRQIDLIIWAPYPVPAYFEVENFGLVPKSSAFGVIEIKRSNYSDVDDQLEKFLEDVRSNKIVTEPSGPIEDYKRLAGLGVICILDSQPSARLKTLLMSKNVVSIFERSNDEINIRPNDILTHVNFSQFVTWRYRVHSSRPGYPQVIDIS